MTSTQVVCFNPVIVKVLEYLMIKVFDKNNFSRRSITISQILIIFSEPVLLNASNSILVLIRRAKVDTFEK